MANGTGKPNKPLERTTGIGAAVLTPLWIFIIAVHVIDWVSRGQTMMALDPYIHYLVTPWAEIGEFFLAVGLLFYATRLEHFREADEAPRIILAYTEPEKPKRHWFWIKLGAASGSLALIAAMSLFVWLHYSHPRQQLTEPVSASPSPMLPPAFPPTHTPPRRGRTTPDQGSSGYLIGNGLVIGDAYYFKGDTLTLAEANASTTLPAVCVASSSTRCIYSGTINTGTWTWKSGGTIYLSDSVAGALTQTEPSTSGHCVQVVAFAISKRQILIKPSSDFGCIQ